MLGTARIDFSFIYARLMTVCGYTPAEIDDMTFHDVLALFTHWREFPPAHEILKCVYGIERRTERAITNSSRDPSGIGGLVTRFPSGFVRLNEHG